MFYKKEYKEVLTLFESQIEGITLKLANERIKKEGYNELQEKEKKSVWKLFIESFKDPLVIILLIAALVQVFLGEIVESSIIFAVLILNSILGVIQTKKSEGSLDSLKQLSVPNSKVIRDSRKITVSSRDIVTGDIVILEAGDYVPADGRIIESQALKVVEGMLTGESEPVLKHNEKIDEESPLGEQKNMVFSGSMVVYGRAIYVVTGCGMNTEVGKIANLLDNAENKQTPLQKKLDDFGKKLGIGIVALSAVIFSVQVFRGSDIAHSFMFAIAIAVAAIPEALSSIVTIVLSMGTNTMAKKQAIIRKLPAVETLGSTSVICTDKTGTLTQNKMTVVDSYMYGVEQLVLEDNIAGKEVALDNMQVQEIALYLASTLCNDSDVTDEGVEIGDPTEIALRNYLEKNNLSYKKLRKKYNRLSELPFDSERKLMSTVNKIDNDTIMFTKGAPDVVFNRCKYVLNNGELLHITSDIINEYNKINEEFSNKALRVLAFATKNIKNEKIVLEDEDDLTLIGLIAMIDPPREEVYEAVSDAKRSGIKTVMITGDHKTTAAAIAKDIGIMEDGDLALTGQELDSLSDLELDNNLDKISVYARVSPENKIRIVKAWQRKGKVTAMTGDGVNDAPALKQADIGISMGSGTEVAKDASAMILLDDNFATIVKAVEVGRTVYNNIKKSVTYLFAGNLGGIIAILFAVMANWSNPFTTLQLLFINLVTDSLPAIALGLEKSEKNIMDNHPRHQSEGILSAGTLKSILIRGSIIGFVTIIAQYIGMKHSPELGTAMAFSTLTLSRIIQTFASRSNTETIFKLGFTSNKYVLGSVVICIAIFLIVLMPFMREVFAIPSTYGLINFIMSFSLAVFASLMIEGNKFIKK
ncbi:MAG: cation-translocating P-type ATPase [Romboutsia sp.]